MFADGATVNIDQSDATGEAVVLVYGGSVIDAADAASFKVRSKGSALRVGNDFLTNANQSSTAPITGSFNNADWAISDPASAAALLRVGPNQASVGLDFTGKGTELMPTASGYLMDVEDSSNAVLNLSQGDMTGTVRTASTSTLTVNMDDRARWFLRPAGADNVSSFTTLNLNGFPGCIWAKARLPCLPIR